VDEGGNVERVRRLWEAWAHGGIDEVIEIVDPDVDWRPYGGHGRVLHGAEELRGYMDEFRERGEDVEAEVYSYEAVGDAVLASGHVRHRSARGLTDTQLHWLYRFRNGRLVRFDAYTSREEALAAASENSH
jgi:ketosteroid isomerase-like protein